MSLETINIDRLGLRPGDKLLDLGCGEGRHSISTFLQADIHVVGLDLSAKDLATAKQRLSDFVIDKDKIDHCSFIRASGFTLPFADDSFDQVICSEVLEHIVEYEKVLTEIKRIQQDYPALVEATSPVIEMDKLEVLPDGKEP